jgi:hypothetical protein
MPTNPLTADEVKLYRVRALAYMKRQSEGNQPCSWRGFARFLGYNPLYLSSNDSSRARAIRRLAQGVWSQYGKPVPGQTTFDPIHPEDYLTGDDRELMLQNPGVRAVYERLSHRYELGVGERYLVQEFRKLTEEQKRGGVRYERTSVDKRRRIEPDRRRLHRQSRESIGGAPTLHGHR